LLQDLGQSLIAEYDVVIMDFRGHGKSRGLFHWASKEPMDLESVLRDVHNDYEKICTIGFSFGAGISMIVAATTDLIDNLIYVSGPAEFKKIDFRWWELDVENDIIFNLGEGGKGKGVRPGPFWFPKKQPIKIVGKLTIPIFYIHGEEDWTIKPWHSEKLYEKTTAQKRLKIIKGGPHAEYLMRKNKDEFVSAIKLWFNDTF
jgi:pimeloyl-ACP methyl ester carboxylesterase